MYFVVIMAFALVLSEGLPPEGCDLLARTAVGRLHPVLGVLAIVCGQLLAVGVAAAVSSRLTTTRLDPTPKGHDRSVNTLSKCHRVLLGIIATALVGTMVFTSWPRVVREDWGLENVPLLGDWIILTPFFLSLTIVWIVLYPVETRIRKAATALAADDDPDPSRSNSEAAAALATARLRRPSPDNSLSIYLLDKFRHQILIIVAPMSLIVFAKFFTDLLRPVPGEQAHGALEFFARLPWAADALLGLVSICVLTFAPLMLRFIWATEPLPAGALRDRFVKTCDRIGLRYREILLWHTHGTAINAAVMGFVGPLRYILVSDALLETMDEEEIEAVFGHEAGHVRHHHLQFFALFALLSMYLAGGVFWLLLVTRLVDDFSLLQAISLAVLLASWLFGFGWLSRRFERQADLFGAQCLADGIQSCTTWCPVHGSDPGPGLCVGAASLFGRTLARIADLNGIPRDAPSWRHGSIDDRRRLIERFAQDHSALKRFNLKILVTKVGLVAACLVGTAGAVWIYGADVVQAVQALFRS